MYRFQDGIEFLRSLPDQSVDGIFTDPPWGSGPDIMGQANAPKLIADMFSEAERILKPNGRVLVWMGIRFIEMVMMANWQVSLCEGKIVARKKLDYRWSIFCFYMPPRYFANMEAYADQILYFARSPQDSWPLKFNGKSLPQIYFKASAGKPDGIHPCSRPIKTIRDILLSWFRPGEYIIDPFAGSDTTGVACRELNLRYDSCEIDPIMYQAGLARHAQGILFEKGASL